ncbi:MAG: hypothetical protein ACREDO_08365 [Methyloceanibacter sp.]
MRLLLGIVLGVLLTIVGLYMADAGAGGVERRPMVNWDVVGQRVDDLTAGAQTVWNDFTREVTGPP